jgi:hypothetical protein
MQTILTAVLEVAPKSADLLRTRIGALGSGKKAREKLSSTVPTLHFMSMSVFADDQYDPIFVLEANFDGRPGPFWAQLEAVLGAELRDMLRCCRAPRDGAAGLFDAVTRAGSRAPIAPLLEARTVWPAARHQGNRGLDRNRILEEACLFSSAQAQLNRSVGNAATSARQVHDSLRKALLPTFGWLDRKPPPRVSLWEGIVDLLRFGVPILLLVAVLAAPGALLGYRVSGRLSVAVLLGLVSLLACLGVLAIALRWIETRDPPQDDPVLDGARLRAMAQLEDQITQNHMISLAHVKPGILRTILVRAGLFVVGHWVRVTAHSGYLGSMRTIHFAHWSLVSNGGRLMFHSNFDGSWESYLDDFIEKAHAGLTAVWTHGVGFPPTRLMLRDGATSGGKFKAWARHTMNESQFWYSAYPKYSVNQIERHARVASGLRKRTLTEEEAAGWALDL